MRHPHWATHTNSSGCQASHFFFVVFLSAALIALDLFFFAHMSLKRSKSDISLRALRTAIFLAQALSLHFFRTSPSARAFFSVFSRAPLRIADLKSVSETHLTGICWRATPVSSSGPSTITRRWLTMSTTVQTFPSQGP